MNYRQQAEACVGGYVLERQKELFASCGRDLDRFYGQEDDALYGYRVIEPGRVYELRYHKCTCGKVLSGQITSREQCECSRQSILYVLEQLKPEAHFEVELLESVLRGDGNCRFRITVMEENNEA